MTESSRTSANALDTVDCVSYRLRRAARIAARSYDAALRPTGLRTTQFTLLASLNRRGETSIGDLSQGLAIDGTTLTRNLEVLVRRGLVENLAVDDARVRNLRLTDLGRAAHEEALPLWRQAQQHVLGAIGPKSWTGMKAQLRRIEAACDDR